MKYKMEHFGQTMRGHIYELVEVETGKVIAKGTRTEMIAEKKALMDPNRDADGNWIGNVRGEDGWVQ